LELHKRKVNPSRQRLELYGCRRPSAFQRLNRARDQGKAISRRVDLDAGGNRRARNLNAPALVCGIRLELILGWRRRRLWRRVVFPGDAEAGFVLLRGMAKSVRRVLDFSEDEPLIGANPSPTG